MQAGPRLSNDRDEAVGGCDGAVADLLGCLAVEGVGGVEDRVGAALVPGGLGDVAPGRGLGGGVVGGAPEGGAAVGHVEVGAADGDVVGGAGEAVDGDAVGCGRDAGVVASGGAGVSAGEKDGDALGGGLLPEGLVEGVAGGAEEELALAVAVAHDGGEVVVDDVEGGEVGALHDLGALGDDVVDGGGFGDGGGPLGVDVGFAFVAGDAGVGAVVDDVEVLGAGGGGGVAEREVEELAEVDEVGGIDVGLADDGDGLAGAVDGRGGVPEGEDIVDGGEVVGGDAVEGFAVVDGEGGLGGLDLGLQRRGAVGGGVVVEVAEAVAGGAAGEVVKRHAPTGSRKQQRGWRVRALAKCGSLDQERCMLVTAEDGKPPALPWLTRRSTGGLKLIPVSCGSRHVTVEKVAVRRSCCSETREATCLMESLSCCWSMIAGGRTPAQDCGGG